VARQRSAIRNWAEYVLVRLVLISLAYGPSAVSFWIGGTYARLLAAAVPRLRRVARANLAAALPSLTIEAREQIVNEVFQSIGRVLVLFARFPRLNSTNVNRWIRMEGFENVETALTRGRGVLVATGHLGNWEFSAFAFALLKTSMNVVVRPLDNPLLDSLVTRYRQSSGNRVISKTANARQILTALGRNELVGVLADQNFQSGVFVDFFGIPAASAPGLAKIATHAGAPVIPGFALWSEKERKYVLRFYPEVGLCGDVTADTQAIQKAIEAVAREHPGQWLWVHRRWKTRPESPR
jgi:KDO2-lipid IV(A) lauroyltransferase